MTARTERRRRLKNRKRGRVAQPDITLGREMIPGVPAFHEGGIVHNMSHRALGGGGQPSLPPAGTPNLPPGFPQPGTPEFQDMMYFIQSGQMLGMGPQQAQSFLGLPNFLQQQLWGGAAGGGTAAPQWRPGEFGLQERGLALQEESQALQAEIQRARLELDQQIATQQFDLARQTEARIREMENRRIQLDQQSLQLQRELGFGGLDLQRELGLMGGALTGRGQDVTQRGQDIDALLAQMGLGVQARGQDVTMRGQDIAAQMQANQQQIGLFEQQRLQAEARGELQLARDIEERQRALQRQNATLQQHQAALASAGLGIEAQRGAGGQMGQLAIGLGNIEARRAENLQRLAANPRDTMQLMFAMGGGQNFLNQLMAGQPITGQSTAQIGGTPTLGPGFERLVGEVTRRRDLPFFEEARGMTRGLAQMGQNVPQAPSLALLQQLGRMPGQGAMPAPIGAPTLTQPNFPQIGAPDLGLNLPKPIAPVPMAGGGRMVTDEPVVGIGMLSGQKKFTLGEPAPGYPFGKPEKMEITPFQQGGSVMAGSWASKPGQKPPLKFGGLAAPTRAQATPTAAAPKAAAPAPIRAPTAAAAAPKPPAPPPVQITINTNGPTGGSGALPVPNPPIPPPGHPGSPFPAPGPPIPPGGPFPAPGPVRPPAPAPSPVSAPAEPPPTGFTGPWPEDVPKIDPFSGLPINIDPETGRPVVIDPDTGEVLRPWNPWPRWAEHPRPSLPAPTGPQMSPGQLIRLLQGGLNARSLAGMLPSQRGLMESIISALGIPPEDFWASVQSTFPTGMNPGRISMGTNFGRGGTIIAPSWSGQYVA